jgi:6-phosphogluconolactonase
MIKSFSIDEIVKAFIQTANEAIESRGRFLVSLAGGNTPMKLYEKLALESFNWNRVHFFWGDERCVPVDDAGNNYGQAKKVFLDKINAIHIHRIQSELPPDLAAIDYATTLKLFAEDPFGFPRFDLVLLGLGEDGHTASLFPNSPVDIQETVIAVTAQYQDRPANRVTLTQKVFNEAREIWFLVTGKNKAEVLNNVINGEKNEALYPAQRIQPTHGNLIWWCDKDASSLL